MTQGYQATRTIDVVAGVIKPVALDGEFFVVQSANGSFEFRVNGGEWIPGQINVRVRLPDPERVSRVSFRATGNVVLVLVHGVGDYQDPSVNISNSVNVVEPAAVDVTAGAARITTAVTYQDKRALSVFNAGGANITAAGVTLAPGEFLGWRVDRQNERLTDITVDATGSTALIGWTA